MKLTPAEEFSGQIVGAIHSAAPITPIVRQIQADALRAGAVKCRNHANLHSHPDFASIAEDCANILEHEANQLHQLREGKAGD